MPIAQPPTALVRAALSPVRPWASSSGPTSSWRISRSSRPSTASWPPAAAVIAGISGITLLAIASCQPSGIPRVRASSTASAPAARSRWWASSNTITPSEWDSRATSSPASARAGSPPAASAARVVAAAPGRRASVAAANPATRRDGSRSASSALYQITGVPAGWAWLQRVSSAVLPQPAGATTRISPVAAASRLSGCGRGASGVEALGPSLARGNGMGSAGSLIVAHHVESVPPDP